jgi:hypothetical protein
MAQDPSKREELAQAKSDREVMQDLHEMTDATLRQLTEFLDAKWPQVCAWHVHTAILIIIEGHKTAFNGFQYQFTTGNPLKNLKMTLIYIMRMAVCTRVLV